MSEIKDRLLKFISNAGITVSEFEKRASLSNGAVSKTNNNIRKSTLNSISLAFPNLNMDWLINGNGEMLKPHTDKLDIEENTDFSLVPLINIDSVGGMDSSNVLTSGEQFVERLIPFTGAKKGDRAIYQSGDSMLPTIPPGSVLQIRKVDDWQEYFGYGGVFVLWLKDDRRITKQVMKYTPDPKNYVTCHSFNPDSADEELPKRFIREVWKVIKVLTDKGW